GILIEKYALFYFLENEAWDSFINDDDLYQKVSKRIGALAPIANAEQLLKKIDAPMQNQELWASGVTYIRSKQGRQEESEKAGGADFYARVYEAERPELFFK